MLLFRALASGSSGNSFLLRTAKSTLLFDAGLRLPRLVAALRSEDVHPQDVSAVLISHEHRDHCLAASELCDHFGVPVHANDEVLRAAGLAGARNAAVLQVGRPALFGDVCVTTFAVAHDSVRPVGFFIETQGKRIAVATDLGSVNAEVCDAIASADLVVLEANHDLEMLHSGRYPAHLRRRVAGNLGHLSNVQAADALGENVRASTSEVWLAHLSKENNTPHAARRTVERILKSVGLGSVPVDVLARDRPSLRWSGQPKLAQLSLFDNVSGGL